MHESFFHAKRDAWDNNIRDFLHKSTWYEISRISFNDYLSISKKRDFLDKLISTDKPQELIFFFSWSGFCLESDRKNVGEKWVG